MTTNNSSSETAEIIDLALELGGLTSALGRAQDRIAALEARADEQQQMIARQQQQIEHLLSAVADLRRPRSRREALLDLLPSLGRSP